MVLHKTSGKDIVMAKYDGVNVPLNYDVTGTEAVVKIEKIVKGIGDATEKLQTQSEKFFKSYLTGFSQAGLALNGIKEMYSGLVSIAGSGIQSAIKYEGELARIRGVLKSQGKGAYLADELERVATGISKTTLLYKSDVLESARIFSTFEHVSQTVMPQAMEAAAGMATVLGVDLRTATLALGKALESPAEGMKALGRVGAPLEAQEKERIRLFEEEGKTYEAQMLILDKLALKYRSLGSEQNKTEEFRLNQIDKSLKSLQKNVGIIELNVISPFIVGTEKLLGTLQNISPLLSGGVLLAAQLTGAYILLSTTGMGSVIGKLMVMGPSIQKLNIAKLEAIATSVALTGAEKAEAIAAFEAAQANASFFTSMGPIGWAVVGITALVGVIGLVAKDTEEATKATDEWNKQMYKATGGELKLQIAGIGAEIEALTKKLLMAKEEAKAARAGGEDSGTVLASTATLEAEILEKKKQQTAAMERQKQLLEDIRTQSLQLLDELEIESKGTDKERRATSAEKWHKNTLSKIEEAFKSGAINDAERKRSLELLQKAYANKRKDDTEIIRKDGKEDILMEELRESVRNANTIADMYTHLNQKWAEIDKLQVMGKNKKIDLKATGEQREKLLSKTAELVQKEIEKVVKAGIDGAEVTAKAAGGDALDIAREKLIAFNTVLAEIAAQEKSMRAAYPNAPNVLDEDTRRGLNTKRIELQGQLDDALYQQAQTSLQREGELYDAEARNRKQNEADKISARKWALEEMLRLAEMFGKKEEAENYRHQLRLNEIERNGLAQKQAERMEQYRGGINKKGADAGYSTEVAGEQKSLEDERRKILNDEVLTTSQKNTLIEELERAHGEQMIEIRRKYYDSMLGQMFNLSKAEIQSFQNIVNTASEAIGQYYQMAESNARSAATAYRNEEYSKMDVNKQAALNAARTTSERNAIEAAYAKKKEAIDAEAEKKGRERMQAAFTMQKIAGYASAMISTYTGAAAAWEPPPIGAGPVGGWFLFGTVLAKGLATAAAISQQEMPKFATGGPVSGKGSGTSDSILARVSNGEYIINAASARQWRSELDFINKNPRVNTQAGAARVDYSGMGAVIEGAIARGIASAKIQVMTVIGDSDAARISRIGISKMKGQKF